MIKLTVFLAPLMVTAMVALDAPDLDPPDIKEWLVPWEKSRPRDPFVDAKGRVWFVGQEGNYIAYLEPETGYFDQYEIAPGTHPHNLVVDRKGMVWFTGNRNGRLVRLDPDARMLTSFPIPDQAVRDPHTMVLDGQGNPWFTAQQSDAVGYLDVAAKEFRIWRTGAGTRPYGIALDLRGRAWFDLFGTNKIGMIDPSGGEVKTISLPDSASRPRRIGVTTDGIVWYTDYTRGYVGRLDPQGARVQEFALPGGRGALPYAMAIDDRERVWVAETGVRPNRLVAFHMKKRVFTDTVALGGGDAPNTIRHMVFHAPTREIWFGTDLNTIGRLRLQ